MKRFALIGSDLTFTQAKWLHSELGDYEYNLVDIRSEDELEGVLRSNTYDGFNITHPFRSVAGKYIDELSRDAERSGVVNVVKKLPDGRLRGYNADMDAFRYLLNDSAEGKQCTILGSGAAARSAATVLSDLGASEVIMVSHKPEEAAERLGGPYTVTGYSRLWQCYGSEIIVNCTGIGKYPDVEESPLSKERLSVRPFTGLELAIDLAYNPYRTKFLQDARRLTGCHTKSGLDMLIVQAITSRRIWMDEPHDAEIDDHVVQQLKRKILDRQLNVVAVGLPGSGKTTIFRRYAYELGLRFIDTDEETEKLMGCTIQEALTDSSIGEEFFRAMEHQAVKNLCSVRGAVIATGGGTLLNPVNRDLLRANGIVIYVKRPLELLAVKGRPISINTGVKELFEGRDRIYRRVSDLSLINSRIFGEIRERTGEGNSYNYELKGFVYYIARKVNKYLSELAANTWT